MNTIGQFSNNSTTTVGSPYLPGYLLGGVNNNSPNTGSYGRSLGGSYPGKNSYSKVNSKTPPHAFLGSPYASAAERKQQRMSPLSNQRLRDKSAAPPTESLYGTSSSPTLDAMDTEFEEASSRRIDLFSPKSPFVNEMSPEKTLNRSIFSPRQDSIIPQSPTQIDPFYSQGDAIGRIDSLDCSAVTVFGFPPTASSYILQQFSQYGTIEKYESPNTGNWLHIKYQTKMQAKKALSKNGKIFARTMMIGVCPCIKKEIVGFELEKQDSGLVGTPKDFMATQKKPPTMRSLTSGTTPLRNASASSEILNNESGTPQKKDSVVSKALDYVFGW